VNNFYPAKVAHACLVAACSISETTADSGGKAAGVVRPAAADARESAAGNVALATSSASESGNGGVVLAASHTSQVAANGVGKPPLTLAPSLAVKLASPATKPPKAA